MDPGESNASRPARQRKTHVFLPCPYRTDRDRSPGPTPSHSTHSTHVTSLFHADVRLVRTEDEMVEHRDADEVARFM